MTIKMMKNNPSKKIKKGDKVVVISGSDKGKEGEVLKVIRSKDRLTVSGVAVSKKIMKDKTVANVERSIHISNVMLKSLDSGDASRVGFKNIDGKKVRFLKKTGEVVQDKEFVWRDLNRYIKKI